MKIDASTLSKLVRYDPDSGCFWWKHRGEWVVSEGLQSEAGRKRFNRIFAGKPCFTSVDKDGYLYGSVLGKFYRAHSVAYSLINGEWASDTVDHINKVRTDNRAGNLRNATRAIQQQNRLRQKNNKSGVPGVHYSAAQKRWVAKVDKNGRRTHIGSYPTKNEAIAARRNFA